MVATPLAVVVAAVVVAADGRVVVQVAEVAVRVADKVVMQQLVEVKVVVISEVVDNKVLEATEAEEQVTAREGEEAEEVIEVEEGLDLIVDEDGEEEVVVVIEITQAKGVRMHPIIRARGMPLQRQVTRHRLAEIHDFWPDGWELYA